MKRHLISLLVLTAPAYSQNPQPSLTPPRPAAVRAPVPVPVTPAPAAAVPAGTMRFHDVEAQGATRIPGATIAAQFAGLVDRDIGAADLKAALERVDALYAAAGYPLGRAFVPAQRMVDGTLIVKVIEGHIGRVDIVGDNARIKALVARATAALTRERPLTKKSLERSLLLLQEIPGLSVSARFGDTDIATGATPLQVTTVFKPVSFGIVLDNRSGFSGMAVQPYATMALNNMLGMGDQLTLTALLSPRQNDYAFYAASYSQAVGDDGLRIGLDGSWAQALDSVSIRPYAVRTRVEQGALKARYPLIRSSEESLNAQARVYVTNARYNLAGAGTGVIAHDGTVAAELGTDYARTLTPALGIGGGITVTQGLTSLAGEPHTRLHTIPAFTRVRADARAIYTPIENVTLKLSAQGQYSPNSLTASEEINFGGLNFGRGFQPGEVTGDKGVGVSFQPEYRIALGTRFSVTPFLVGDYARVWQKRGDGQSKAELVSAGGGVRLGLNDYAEVSLEADKPLNRIPLNRTDKAWRFHVGMEIGLEKIGALIAGSP